VTQVLERTGELSTAEFALDLSAWNPVDHPRDSHGRFRDKWGLPDAAKKMIKRILAAAHPLTARDDEHFQEYADRQAVKKKRTPEQQASLDYMLTEKGWDDVQSTLRAGKDDLPHVRAFDGSKQQLTDDLLLTRVMGPDAFGLPPERIGEIEEWTGKLISDMGYTSTNLGTPYKTDGPHVTMSLLTPRGTQAVFPGGSREVILDRDQPIRIMKVEADGKGGVNVYGVVEPMRATGRGPARNLGAPLPAKEHSPATAATPEEMTRRGLGPDGSPLPPATAAPAAAPAQVTPGPMRAVPEPISAPGDQINTAKAQEAEARIAADKAAGRAPAREDERRAATHRAVAAKEAPKRTAADKESQERNEESIAGHEARMARLGAKKAAPAAKAAAPAKKAAPEATRPEPKSPADERAERLTQRMEALKAKAAQRASEPAVIHHAAEQAIRQETEQDRLDRGKNAFQQAIQKIEDKYKDLRKKVLAGDKLTDADLKDLGNGDAKSLRAMLRSQTERDDAYRTVREFVDADVDRRRREFEKMSKPGKEISSADLQPGDRVLVDKGRLELDERIVDHIEGDEVHWKGHDDYGRLAHKYRLLERPEKKEESKPLERPQVPELDAKVAQRAKARERQQEIASRTPIADVGAELDELIDKKATNEVMAEHVRAIAQGPKIEEIRDKMKRAEIAGGLEEIARNLDKGRRAAALKKLATLDRHYHVQRQGKAGQAVKFNPSEHESVGGVDIPEGASVRIVRPGAAVRHEDNSQTQLHKALVSTSTPAERVAKLPAPRKAAAKKATPAAPIDREAKARANAEAETPEVAQRRERAEMRRARTTEDERFRKEKEAEGLRAQQRKDEAEDLKKVDAENRKTYGPWLDEAGIDADSLTDTERTIVNLMVEGINSKKLSRPEASRRLGRLEGRLAKLAPIVAVRPTAAKKAVPAAPAAPNERPEIPDVLDQHSAAQLRTLAQAHGIDTRDKSGKLIPVASLRRRLEAQRNALKGKADTVEIDQRNMRRLQPAEQSIYHAKRLGGLSPSEAMKAALASHAQRIEKPKIPDDLSKVKLTDVRDLAVGHKIKTKDDNGKHVPVATLREKLAEIRDKENFKVLTRGGHRDSETPAAPAKKAVTAAEPDSVHVQRTGPQGLRVGDSIVQGTYERDARGRVRNVGDKTHKIARIERSATGRYEFFDEDGKQIDTVNPNGKLNWRRTSGPAAPEAPAAKAAPAKKAVAAAEKLPKLDTGQTGALTWLHNQDGDVRADSIRKPILERLLRDKLVTHEGDRVKLTELGRKAFAAAGPQLDADVVAERLTRAANEKQALGHLEGLNLAQLRKVATATNLHLPPAGTKENKDAETLRAHIARSVVAGRRPRLPAEPVKAAKAARLKQTREERVAELAARTDLKRQSMIGTQAETTIETAPDGEKIVRKRFRDTPEAKHMVDAEVLGPKVVEALGLRAPAAVPVDKRTVAMEHIEGKVGDTVIPYGQDVPKTLLDSEDGRMIGLADYLTDSTDRNPGNWIQQPDGRLATIDHADMFLDTKDPHTPPHVPWGVWGDFGGYLRGPDDADGNPTLAEHIDIPRGELIQLRERLQALKPQFEERGRADWHKQVMRRLSELEARVDASQAVKKAEAKPTVANLSKLTVGQLKDEFAKRKLKVPPRAVKADLVRILEGPGPAGQHHVDAPPSVRSLRSFSESDHQEVKYFTKGEVAATALLEHNGRKVVRKRHQDGWNIPAEDQSAAENLASRTGQAVTASVPAVYQRDARTVYMDHAEGKLARHIDEDRMFRLADSPQGQRIAILDAMIGNQDRHPENWLADDEDHITGIDHGTGWFLDPGRQPDGSFPPAEPHFEDAFADFVSTAGYSGREWKDRIPFSRAELDRIRARFVKLRSEFVLNGKEAWYDTALGRLDEIIKRASLP
jgi:uncharacterized protein YeeX (DUF496 family)